MVVLVGFILLLAGAVLMVIGMALGIELMETIGAWLMVPITAVAALALLLLVTAYALRPFAAVARAWLRCRRG